MATGKFFVFEGIDGAGKSTQSNLLADFFKRKGIEVQKIDFPQYGQRSAALIEDYLKGKYGSSQDVGPYVASIFYAADRYYLRFKIKQRVNEGKIVVSDRYAISNIGHQGGKLIESRSDWEKYTNWLHDLEYNLFKIPKPDYTFILKITPELSMQMSNKITDVVKQQKRIAYLGDDKKQDIHEADKKHLANALDSYLAISEKFSEEYKIIDCMENGNFLPVNVISEKIIKLVEEKI